MTSASHAGPQADIASRALAESLPGAGVLVLDTQLRIMYAEGNLFARLGVDVRAQEGTQLQDWAGPDRWVGLAPRYEAALAGEPQSFEQWERAGVRVYSIEITPVRDEDGEVSTLLAVFQEVTEHAKVVQALERSETRLRVAERMVGLGSFERDLATGALTYSDGFMRLLGLSPDDEIDMRAYARMIHPDDRARRRQGGPRPDRERPRLGGLRVPRHSR